MRKGFPNHNHGPSKKRELRTGPETVVESQEPLQRLFCLEWQLLARMAALSKLTYPKAQTGWDQQIQQNWKSSTKR